MNQENMPPDQLEISCEHETLSLPIEKLDAWVRNIIIQEGYRLEYLGILLTDHETVLELNREYLQHDYVTDVLSFPFQSDDITRHSRILEGEVYVDLDTALERAPEFDSTFEQEALRYVVHGLLHLLGHDDDTPEGKAQMHKLEDTYLGAW